MPFITYRKDPRTAQQKAADEDVCRIVDAAVASLGDADPNDVWDVLRRQRLHGDKDLGKVHRLLMRAFGELGEPEGDPVKIRHAAYTGWRAARAAVYAVLRAHGEPFYRPLRTASLEAFEAEVLGRRRHQPLTIGYIRAKLELYHEGYCDGRLDCFRPDVVYEALLGVGHLLDQAEKDTRRAKRR